MNRVKRLGLGVAAAIFAATISTAGVASVTSAHGTSSSHSVVVAGGLIQGH